MICKYLSQDQLLNFNNKLNLQNVVPSVRVSRKPVAKRLATVVANVAASSATERGKKARRVEA